jgi:hypothetical protein
LDTDEPRFYIHKRRRDKRLNGTRMNTDEHGFQKRNDETILSKKEIGEPFALYHGVQEFGPARAGRLTLSLV